MDQIYIFDLDSTLANIDHRLPYRASRDDPQGEFNLRCVDDAPIPHMVSIYRLLYGSGARCTIWTGRTEAVRQQTQGWLNRHVFQGDTPHNTGLRMRPLGDTRQDNVLKEEWLLGLAPSVRAKIACAFDDRDRVVAMYRRHGVPCLQVAPGNF